MNGSQRSAYQVTKSKRTTDGEQISALKIVMNKLQENTYNSMKVVVGVANSIANNVSFAGMAVSTPTALLT